MTELERLAELNKPIPTNPPHLLVPTRVRVLRPFMVKGQRVEVGAVVELQFHVARDLASIGKCEVLP